jgi:hypothetical protein
MPVQKNNKVQSKRTSVRRGGEPNDDKEDPGKIIDKILLLFEDLKTTVAKFPDSDKLKKEWSETKDPERKKEIEYELAESGMTGFHTALPPNPGQMKSEEGGKGKKKTVKKTVKSRKFGGSEVLVGAPIINTSSLLNNADPTTQANAYIPALYSPTPFSAGIPQYPTADSGFPDQYLTAMSGKYLGGAKKSKSRTTRKTKN